MGKNTKKVTLVKDWKPGSKVYKPGFILTMDKKQADELIKEGFAK